MAEDSAADDKPKPFLGLSGTQTLGSALAAVASAFVGSFLGVAGTLIGAAIGSIVATVATALFARTLTSAAVAAKRIPRSRRIVRTDDGGTAAVDTSPAVTEFGSRLARRRFTPKTWLRIGAVSGAAFALAIIGVTVLELGTSQPISALMSSTTSSSTGTTGPQTTLGEVLGGQPAAETVPAEESGQGTDDGGVNGIPGGVTDGDIVPTQAPEDPGTLPAEAPPTEEAPAPGLIQEPAVPDSGTGGSDSGSGFGGTGTSGTDSSGTSGQDSLSGDGSAVNPGGTGG